MIYKPKQPIVCPPKLPIDDGLILYLPCNERSGSVLYNLSGASNANGSFSGGAYWEAAKGSRGRVFTCDGIDSRALFFKDPIPTSGNFSLMGWIYCFGEQVGDTDKRGGCFSNAGWTGSNLYGLAIRRNEYQLQLAWGDSGSGLSFSLIGDISTTNKQKWYHVAGVYDSSTTTMYGYVNAKLINSGVQAYEASGNDFRVGWCALNATTAYWYGQIKNIRVYNSALSVDELRKIYEAEK